MVFYIFTVIFLGMALVCFMNKGLHFVKDWNNSDIQKYYNTKKINIALGIILAFAGLIFLFSGSNSHFYKAYFMLFMILWFGCCAFLLFLLERTSFFKLEKEQGGKDNEHKQ